jgi:UDP-N-acetyl-D-mannosaminuronate dehydrogenase
MGDMSQITDYTLPPEGRADTRETPVMRMIKELKEFGIEISGFDPLLGREEIEAFGIDVAEDIKGMDADCIIVAVAHDAFKDISLNALKEMMSSDPILVDIRGMFGREDAERMGFCYRGL